MKKNLCITLVTMLLFASCDGYITTYNVRVSGIVVDAGGDPVDGAVIKVVDRQSDANAMFGSASNAYIDRHVGTTTTDEKGHYSLTIKTEGMLFDISAIKKEETWDYYFAQSASVRCECKSGKIEYQQDMVTKTEKMRYTGIEWQNVVELSTLEVNLVDSIFIRLKDGGTIQSAGVWFDCPWVDNSGQYHHDFQSGLNMYFYVNGGDFCMPAGLCDYELKFQIDTTAATRCAIPYAERCFLKVESDKESNTDGYFIRLKLK